MKNHRVIRSLLALTVAASVALPWRTSAQSYEVKGEIVYTPGPTGKDPKHTTYEFRVVVDGDKWLIRNTPKVFKGIKFQEVGFDGEELRQLTQMDPTANPKSVNHAIGLIELESTPAAEPPMQIGPVWLALASSSYLRSRTNDQLTPIWPLHVGVRELGHQMRGDWKLSSAAPKLPTEVRYYSDGKNYSIKDGALRGSPTGPPYDQGYLQAQYTVEGFTNVSGLSFPTGFTFDRFAPKRDGASKEDVFPNARVQGKVHSITVGIKDAVFSPTLTSATWVVDRRSRIDGRSTKSIDYVVKDNVWPKAEAAVAGKK